MIEAGALFGAEPYMSEAAYRANWRAAAFGLEDIDACSRASRMRSSFPG